MKIVGGLVKGRKLIAPGKRGGSKLIRPTSSRAREAVFNIIGPQINKARVLDLFAGTGAMGLEALSRGARSVVFVDQAPKAINLIIENVKQCGFSEKSAVIRKDLTKSLSVLKGLRPSEGFNLIFVDPPYREQLGGQILELLDKFEMVCTGGLVIIEHSFAKAMPEVSGALKLHDQRRYGQAGFWFYCRH